ncbi:MAG: hypothetical protein LBV48_01040 [Mycoplasmataceae bacterium]|nr:hypothetical protein [Mycoplasmataceae bacterium]
MFIISTCIYIIIFFIHRRARKNATNIKITYNELQNFNQNISFNNIKIYAKNNKQVDKFINIVTKEKEDLNTWLNSIYENIISLSKINNKFEMNKSKIISKIINANLVEATQLKNNISSACKKFEEYIDNVDNIYVNLTSVADTLMEFYEKNLLKRYSNEVCDSLVVNIHDSLRTLNEIREKNFEKYEFIEKYNEIYELLNNFATIIFNIFKYSKIISYLEVTENEISKMDFEELSISQNEITYVKQQIVIGDNAVRKMKSYLKDINFSEVESFARIGCNAFERTLSKIILNKKINEMINQDFEIMTSQINILSNSYSKISDDLNKLEQKIGRKDKHISSMLNSDKMQITEILQIYQELSDGINNGRIINDEISEIMVSIIEKIIDCCEKISSTINEINVKYSKFIKINDEFSKNKNVIGQLINLKMKYSPNDMGIVATLNSYFESIEEVYEKLSSNYELNYESSVIELQKIKQELEHIVVETSNDVILYKYCEELFMFLNKYRREHDEIKNKLDYIESLIQEHNSTGGIDELIALGEKIKRDGASYGIKIE